MPEPRETPPMSEPKCDPNAVPLTREQQLERIIEQMRAEASERARAYDDNNAFLHRRIDALHAEIRRLREGIAFGGDNP